MRPHDAHPRGGYGFTLLELLIVVVVLSIIAMVVVPQIGNTSNQAREEVLRGNLKALRRSVERFHLDHNGLYPGAINVAGGPVTPANSGDLFASQLATYTDARGQPANVKDGTHRFGPYLVGGQLPQNPFNDRRDVAIDNTETNIMVRQSRNAGTAWKFYRQTGALIAADGGHDNI